MFLFWKKNLGNHAATIWQAVSAKFKLKHKLRNSDF